MDTLAPPLLQQIAWLFVLALPVAVVAWTVTHEEVLREAREFCVAQSKIPGLLIRRKFFYLFTCEYCFSHYVAAFFVWLLQFQLLVVGWRGYVVAWLAVTGVANLYMSFFGRLRVEIKSERLEVAAKEEALPESKTKS
jgi:hypothetical protein